MQLSESAEGAGAITILIRIEGKETVAFLHQGLIGLSRVEEVRCRRYDGGWLLTACGAANADPDILLSKIGVLVDQMESRAEVLDVRRGANELPLGGDGFQISPRFRVVGDGGPVDSTNIRLNAAHVFGTGAHASTRLAVQALEELADKEGGLAGRVLDVGTGSGILALVAARLGGQTVTGIDICAEAVSIARGNVLANGLQDRIMIDSTPLSDLSGSFDLVIANVTASVLIRLASGIVNLIKPGSCLIASGLQGRQGDEIEAGLLKHGLQAIARYGEGKWRCLVFRNGSSI